MKRNHVNASTSGTAQNQDPDDNLDEILHVQTIKPVQNDSNNPETAPKTVQNLEKVKVNAQEQLHESIQVANVSEILNEQLPNKYRRVQGIGKVPECNMNWSDKFLLEKDHLDIAPFQNMRVQEIIPILEFGLSSLVSETSAFTVGNLVAGASLLLSCEDPGLYLYDLPQMKKTPTSIAKLDTIVVAESGLVLVKYDENIDMMDWVKSASFMCAAALRLVTEDATNLRRAWEHLMAQFANFYQKEIAFQFKPSDACVKEVRNILQNQTLIRNTVGLLLLAHQQLEGRDKGLSRMLFEMHLAYTGMHAYSLILFCAHKLGVALDIFFALLDNPVHRPALKSIMELLIKYEKPNTEANKLLAANAKTWKYARLFDPKTFSSVRTSNCGQLVGLLACIAQKIGPSNSGDVRHIKQVQKLIAGNADWFEAKAAAIINYCLGGHYEPKELHSGIFH